MELLDQMKAKRKRMVALRVLVGQRAEEVPMRELVGWA
jgi:hypothetical protein